MTLEVGQLIAGWQLVEITFPVGEETWSYPDGWIMIALINPQGQGIVLALPPEDQNDKRVRELIREEERKRSPWMDKILEL